MAVAARRPLLREDRRPPAAQRSAVEHVVVHERGHVQQLHRRRGGHELLVVVAVGAQEDEHGPQPLAARGERAAGVAGQLGAVAAGHLGEPRLGALEQAGELLAARPEHRPELCLSRVHDAVPAWMAMIPPAVRIQCTSSRPAAAMRAASSSGPGKRRTLEGR